MNTKKYLSVRICARMMLSLVFVIAPLTAAHAATFTVTNTNDSGAGSLRQAVNEANATPGSDTINFDSAIFSTPQTITLTNDNINIFDPLTISGPGANLLTISSNNASRIMYVASTLNLNGVTVANGFRESGAAMYLETGSTTSIDASYFRNNNADFGAAIYNGGATLNITNSSFISNTAVNNGGAIYMRDLNGFNATTNITNSTFASNTATNFYGGAIYIFKDGKSSQSVTLDLNYTTIAFNRGGGAGGLFIESGTVFSRNTLYGGNVDTFSNQPSDVLGTVNSQGYNLLSTSVGSSGFSASNNDILDVDPRIDAPADNGGTTPTVRLQANSPAVDQANGTILLDLSHSKKARQSAAAKGFLAAATDQRGMMRPFDIVNVPNAADGSDIGAFELAVPTAANVEVKGRVLTTETRGLRNAVVTITDQTGATRSARTTSFGYFRFSDVAVGQTYIISVNSKRYSFTPQTVGVNDQITDLMFVAGNF